MSTTKVNTPTDHYKTTGLTQLQFLQKLMRGTNKWLTAKEARTMYGIQKLHPRLSMLSKLGLKIKSRKTGNHKEREYKVSARDLMGSRIKLVF
jgi:hypothetical protein